MKKLFKKFTMVVISLILANQICFAAGQKRVCIMDLEDKSGEQHSGWHNVGTGIADMMVTALVKTNKFMVIEREKLNKIMEEQQLGASGAITTQTAAKIGQLLGVNYIITGSVTEFGVKESKLGVGNLGSFLPFGGGVETQTNKARVVIDIRMIDTSTGQILKADKGEGEESSTGVSIDLSSAPSVSFGKEGFDETVIGKATRKCVDMVIKAMVDSLGNQPWSAKIVKVSGKEIYLNSGKKDNEQVGRVIGIYRKGEELIDPDTGLSLGSENTKIGTAKIIKVDENFSVAETSAENVTKDDYLKEEK